MNISASIFYHKENWHELISGVIKPFIETEKKNLATWQIYLSTNRGDHITFAAQILENHQAATNQLSDQLSNFLTENPSGIKAVSYPLGGFFSDFTTNSIYFNLEDANLIIAEDYLTNHVHHVISDIILQVFESEIIDSEVFYTFFIYLILGIIRFIYPRITEARSNALSYLINNKQAPKSYLKLVPVEDENDDIAMVFLKNKPLVKGIVKDIFSTGFYKDELFWMNQLGELCNALSEKSDAKTMFNAIIETAWAHIDINSKTTLQELTNQTLTFFCNVI